MNIGAFWTDEREADLRQMHSEGKSASQIAIAIGAASRNMVCGKIARLGLKFVKPEKTALPARSREKLERPPSSRSDRSFAQGFRHARDRANNDDSAPIDARHATRIALAKARREMVDIATSPASETAVTFAEHRHDQCSWIDGDPRAVHEPLFCGAACKPGSAWCAFHYGICYPALSREARP
jgi:GcrA cell cycle regulator